MKPAPLKDNIFNTQDSHINTQAWVEWLSSLTETTPTISYSNSAPSSVPNKIGDIYADTLAAKVYIATGNSSAADWKILN
jgi:hypothetical protein